MQRRRWAAAAVAIGGGLSLALGAGGLGGTASGDLTPTTIALSDGRAPAVVEAITSVPVAEAFDQLWPGASVTANHEVRQGGADYVEVSGIRKDGSSFTISVYRRFDAAELEAAGLDSSKDRGGGVTWVGATDPDLTSVYYLSADGVGVWLGLSPSRGEPAVTVEEVTASARALTEADAIRALAEVTGVNK